MCPVPIYCLPSLLASWWLVGAATAMASTLNAVAMPWRCSTPSSPLLRLHVQTLRLNPHAGRRPRYAMRHLPLTLVKSN